MINKLKKFANKIGYMFAFGMKGANDEILSQNADRADIGVIQSVENKNLGSALINGEVTQQVEELRYSTYQVLRHADDYSYIGGGNAIKRKRKQKDLNNYSFTQCNSLICEGVGHELARIGEYGVDRFTLEITYTTIMRIKIEPYITHGKFTVKNGKMNIELYFDKSAKSKYDSISYSILKELHKISQYTTAYEILHNEICSEIGAISFVTYKANGEDDMVRYIIKYPKFEKCTEYDDGYILSYSTDDFSREDLTEQYYSESMAQKYKDKAPKEGNISLFDPTDRKEYCSECGEEMNTYDADVTRQTFGRPICIKCLLKKK